MSDEAKIQVVFGKVDVADVLRCRRCHGEGQAVVSSIEAETCQFCAGTGERVPGNTYTYLAREPVAVADVVEVPGNWVKTTPQLATVVATCSDYAGPLSSVLRVVDRNSGSP